MTVAEPAAARAGEAEDPSWVPRRAEGVELIGDYEASGYRTPPALVRRSDGQVLQLTPLLYSTLDAVDGQRSLDELARVVGEQVDRDVSADNVRTLVEDKLVPFGVIVARDGSEPELKRVDPLLGLRLRFTVLGERLTNTLAKPFTVLFHPLVLLPALVAFALAVGWLLGVRGLSSGARQLLYNPALLLAVFAVTALSAGFHEFGHAAACRYSGATPGRMGAGLYLVWPAFFTDVTDAYRLDRRGRLRTDLGGLYFNALFVLATVGVWRITGADAVLILVPLQLLQMLQQLMPMVRLDGYQILSDLCGVPDLFARIKPTLRSLLPGKRDPAVTELKPWVRVVVTAWVLVIVPLLLTVIASVAISFPRIVATAWDSTVLQWRGVSRAAGHGDWVRVAVGVIGTFGVVLPVAASTYILLRTVRRTAGRLWGAAGRVTVGRPALAVLGVALAAGVAFLWWPNGEYRPLQPGERGTIADVVRSVRDVPSGRPALTEERAEELDGAPARADAATTPPPQDDWDDVNADRPDDDVSGADRSATTVTTARRPAGTTGTGSNTFPTIFDQGTNDPTTEENQ